MWTLLTIFFHYLHGTTLWYESTTDPYIINRGAVKVSRTLQTFLKTRKPSYRVMNFRNDTMLRQTSSVLHGLASLKSLRESRSLSTTSYQSFLQSFLKAKKPTKAVYERLVTVADPDLELRGGGGGNPVLTYLPCRPFSLQSFLLFLPKIRGGPGPPGSSPRSATGLP